MVWDAPSLQALSMVITASNGCLFLRFESRSKTFSKEMSADKQKLNCSRNYCQGNGQSRLTCARCRVCSRTSGLSFNLTSPTPSSMCSTNKAREQMRRQPCLKINNTMM